MMCMLRWTVHAVHPVLCMLCTMCSAAHGWVGCMCAVRAWVQGVGVLGRGDAVCGAGWCNAGAWGQGGAEYCHGGQCVQQETARRKLCVGPAVSPAYRP